MDHNLNSKCWV